MRRLATLVVTSLLVVACGSSTPSGSPVMTAGQSSAPDATASGPASTSGAPGGSTAPGTPGGSSAPVGSASPASSAGPDASAVPAATATPASVAACATLNDAISTIDVHMQLMEGMDASIWAALVDPTAGSGFDIATFKDAVDTVSAYPGTTTLAADLKEIVRLMDVTRKASKPFTKAPRPGVLLARTVEKYFTEVGVAMLDLRAAQGCSAV
jgi:hypothetical protein